MRLRIRPLSLLVIGGSFAMTAVAPAIARSPREEATIGFYNVRVAGREMQNTSATTVAAATKLAGVACPGSRSCIAVGYKGFYGEGANGVVLTLSHTGKPSDVHVVPHAQLAAIACTSASECIGVGQNDGAGVIVPIRNGRPGTPILVPTAVGGLAGIACIAGRCLAVGGVATGAVVAVSATGAGTVITIPSTRLLAVACSSASTCVAVGSIPSGGEGVSVPLRNGAPGAVHTFTTLSVEGLDGITCRGGAGCTAVGNGTNASVVVPFSASGKPGSPQVYNTVDGDMPVITLNGVSCVGAVCAAVSSEDVAHIVPIDAPAGIVITGGDIHQGYYTNISFFADACVGSRLPAPCVAVGSTVTPGSGEAFGFQLSTL